jgi:hypothetical protein
MNKTAIEKVAVLAYKTLDELGGRQQGLRGGAMMSWANQLR